jgi:ribosomal protein S18 acetylase RimI-like enzyme
MMMRAPETSEIGHLAQLWHDGWRDAHAGIVPAELMRRRTLARFRERLDEGFRDLWVAGPSGAANGFYMLKGDELYQFYVAAEARGSGFATMLIADAEARLAGRGIGIAWLACAIGNDRAARFYEKAGWHRAATMTSQLDTPEGVFPLEVWRYEKALSANRGPGD